jgi:hypothetical protein
MRPICVDPTGFNPTDLDAADFDATDLDRLETRDPSRATRNHEV